MPNTLGAIRHYSQRSLPAQPDHRHTGWLITLTALLAAAVLTLAYTLTGSHSLTPARPPVGVHPTPTPCPTGGLACLEPR
jgi:hypothetical protein